MVFGNNLIFINGKNNGTAVHLIIFLSPERYDLGTGQEQERCKRKYNALFWASSAPVNRFRCTCNNCRSVTSVSLSPSLSLSLSLSLTHTHSQLTPRTIYNIPRASALGVKWVYYTFHWQIMHVKGSLSPPRTTTWRALVSLICLSSNVRFSHGSFFLFFFGLCLQTNTEGYLHRHCVWCGGFLVPPPVPLNYDSEKGTSQFSCRIRWRLIMINVCVKRKQKTSGRMTLQSDC